MVKFDLSKMAVAARKMQAAAPGPMAYLRMNKNDGSWSSGTEEDPVGKDDLFAVNIQSFQRGFVAWADTTRKGVAPAKLEEHMFDACETCPEPGPLPQGAAKWDAQFAFSAMGMDGRLKGTDVVYATTSYGGKKAVAALMTEIVEGLAVNPGKLPVVSFSSKAYPHVSYGQIYNPIITIKKWIPTPSDKAALLKSAGKPATRKSK